MSYNKGGSSSSSEPQGDTRLFVTKIPRNCTEAELTAHFGNFGELKDVHMPRVPGHGGHKGIAFVSYSDPECAAAVREMGGHIIHGQTLIVDHATQRASGAHRKYLPGGTNFHESSWNPHGHNGIAAYGKGHSHSHGGWGSSHYNDWGSSSKGHGGWGESHHKGGHVHGADWGEASHSHNSHNSNSGSWWESVLGDGASTRAGNSSDAGSDTSLHPTNSHLSSSNKGQNANGQNGGNNNGNSNSNGSSSSNANGGDDFWDSLCNSFWGEGQGQQSGKKGSPMLKGSSCSSNNPFEELSGGPARGSSRESMSYSPPQPAAATAKGSPHLFVNEADKIFVTKIGATITRENLVNYFTQFGELIDVYMPPNCDQSNGLVHKGIAFVSFRDVKTAEHVLKRAQYEIKPGKFIVVDRAKTRRSTGSIVQDIPQTCGAQAQTEAPAARIAPY